MPGFFERLKGAFGSHEKGVEGVVLTPLSDFKTFLDLIKRSGTNPHALVEENKNWVAACVDAIAKSVACIELVAYRYGTDGQVEPVKEHPALDLLAYVNGFMSQFELFEVTSSHLSIFGNAVWLLDGVDAGGRGRPTAIYPLNPKYVRIRRKPLPGLIESYEYTVGDVKQSFTPGQIIHIRETNPDDPLWGMGKLEKSFDSVEADMFSRLWAKAFFKNGARVDNVIEVPVPLTNDQAKQLLEVYNQKHQGIERSHKTAVIPMGGKLVEYGSGIKDMDFANLRQVSRDEILALFGVPRSILGIVEDVNRANAEASNYVFAERTIRPVMQKITDTLNEFLMPFFGDGIWLEFADPVPENRIEQLEIDKAALGGKPFMSVNEVRSRYGLSKIENGDEVMTDFTSVPLGAPLPAPAPKSVRRRGKAEVKARVLKSAAVTVADAIVGRAVEEAKRVKDRADADEAEWKRFVSNVTPYITAVRRALVGVAEDEEKSVLEKLPDAVKAMAARIEAGDPSVKVVNVDELVDTDDSVRIITNVLKPIYQELTEKEGKAVLEKITGAAFNGRTERVQEGLKHAISLLSSEYTRVTKARLTDTLEEGLAAGEALPKLRDRVKDVYKAIETHRAYAVAYTETNRIGNFAAKEAMRQSGVVRTVRWYTAQSNVCPFCEEMQGTVEDLNSAFFDRGDTLTVNGSTLDIDYDAIEHPPLHVNCQCYIRPEEISL